MNTTFNDIIWQPSGQYLNCRVIDFMQSLGIDNWQTLIKRSSTDIEWFWQHALAYMELNWHKPYERLLDTTQGFPWAKWFVGGELNIVSNCLDYHLHGNNLAKHAYRAPVGPNHLALIWEGEDGSRRTLTYKELSDMSCRVASALTNSGIAPGDAVGIYMPMVPEVVAVMFGCLKIGAVAVPVFSGFGPQALQARLADAEAKVLFTADGGIRRGKILTIKKDAEEAMASLPTLKHLIVLNRFGTTEPSKGRPNPTTLDWADFVGKADTSTPTLSLPAEHPCLYLYTSGTTGKPKGTVHTHAGALASIARELGFAFDVQPEDIFFWFTDIGWMMGPWEMIGVTFWGGTMVIYEGAPNYPNPDRLWQVIERNKVTALGISPTAVRVLKAAGNDWIDKYQMESLRLLGSTGEPWDVESYMWYFEKVGKKRCPVINISGGTEIIGCFLQPIPVMPLKPCTLGAPTLGMDVDVVDETGKSIRNSIGHLICKKPSPSMTKGFLKDRQRYLETYFHKSPEIWHHGDWAKVDEDGYWFLYGRSDDTIKIAGKRIGPAEIESILVEHAAVAEAAAIGVPHEIKGEGIVCFVVLMPKIEPRNVLCQELRDFVASKLGSSLRPEFVHAVAALPKTRSGKIVRGAIRKKYLGESLDDLSSIDNPETLEFIEQIAAVQGF